MATVLLPTARTATARSTRQHFPNAEREFRGAMILLEITVNAAAAASITAVRVFLKALTKGSASEIKIYEFGALTLSAVGLYAFLIYPGGNDAGGWTGAIDGPMPPTVEFEVVHADANPITYRLDVQTF